MRIEGRAAARELLKRGAARQQATAPASFEDFATSPIFCGLTLSPLMRDVARVSEGLPPIESDEELSAHFGCRAAELPIGRVPRTVAVRSGGRAGKTSRLLAPKALHAAWTVPLPTLGHGEEAVALLVAPDMKLARQVLSFARGYVEQSPVLSGGLVKTPTTDTVTLRRPDGKIVRVEVLAATRGGRAVRARTLVFAGMDEAAFFYAEGTGVVNDQDIYNAVAQRVVPGGQTWIVSTPWLADVGVLEKTIGDNWGHHRGALVCTSGTRALNPTWDPTGEIERDLRERDPEAARREIDGLPIAGGAATFFDARTIDAAVDKTLVLPRRPLPGERVAAGADLGFSSDHSALAVTHDDREKIRLGELLEMTPGPEPLKPSTVVQTFAAALRERHAGLDCLVADGHYRETMTEHLAAFELAYKAAPVDVAATFLAVRARFREGRVAIPAHAKLIAQLKLVMWRANSGGTITIILPRSPLHGHCDLVSALVLSIWEQGGVDVPAALTEDQHRASVAAKAHKRHWDEEAMDPLERRDLGPDAPWWEQ